MTWTIYGANGYTGRLIVAEALARGLRPVLAGRNAAALREMGTQTGLPVRAFGLDDAQTVRQALKGQDLVLHCAGPFSATSAPMLDACLAVKAHYLDITGEIDVFELAHSVHDKAVRAGVVLCPGVGFDVVPTDSVAMKLREALPDATHLALGFDSRSGLSKGTAKTALESAGIGSRMRRNGKIIDVPFASQVRRIDFGNGERLAVGIAWGDVSTAYYSTGIPNIEVFSATSPNGLKRMQRANMLKSLLRRRLVQHFLKRRIDRPR